MPYLIECPNIEQGVIRNHYDVSTLFYRILWGPHIHHGYWEAQESPRAAQLQLTQRLAKLAQVPAGSQVADIGCGMGGSSVWLAQQLQCEVTGVTISPFQRWWASLSAEIHRAKPRPAFRCCDAERLSLQPASLDLLWSIECTEHLYAKADFLARASHWLRPGGKIAICAWLAGTDETNPVVVEQVMRVCEGMFCPSLGTQQDYISWLEQAGMRMLESQIWTRHVIQTWEICKARVDRSGIRWLARMCGKNHTLFLDRFDAILQAYRSGAMDYGCFVAIKD